MEIISDVENLGEAGFDKYLIRMDYSEGQDEYTSYYINPNTLVSGVMGQAGRIEFGSGNVYIDGKLKRFVVNDGNENKVTLGKLDSGAYGLDVDDGTIEGAWIVAESITAGQIAANTITAAKIAAGTITTTQIAADTIVAGNIAAKTITADEIANTTITNALIVDSTITGAKIASATIENANIANATIEYGKIASISASSISTGTLSADYISGGTISGSKFIASSSGTAIEIKGTGYFKIEDSGGNILGTIDGNSATTPSLFINADPNGIGLDGGVAGVSIGIFGDSQFLTVNGYIYANDGFKPSQATDAGGTSDRIYFSTTDSKLVYKDSGGTVHDLY